MTGDGLNVPTSVLNGKEKVLGERLGAADGICVEGREPIKDGAVLGLKVFPDKIAVGKAVGSEVNEGVGTMVTVKNDEEGDG